MNTKHILTWLFVYCVQIFIFRCGLTDPCVDYSVISDATRSIHYELPFGQAARCDRYDIIEGWYRFEGDRNMPTSAPDPGKCGTNAPIWINGSFPDNSGDTSSVKACKTGFLSTCETSWSINVQNCGLFNVFQLTPIASCEGRYCMGDGGPCPEGTSSDTGFQPCIADTINITIYGGAYPNGFIPTYDPSSPERMLMFACSFWIYGIVASDGRMINAIDLIYDVRWDIDGEEFIVKQNLNFTQIATDGILKSSEWRNTRKKMGFMINCAIRARTSENETTTSYIKGTEQFVGIVVNPKVLHISSGAAAQVWLYSTVPVACVYNYSYPCKLQIELFDFTEQFTPGSQMYCNESINSLTKPSLCGLEINGWWMHSMQPLNITVPANSAENQEYTAVVKLRSTGLSYDPLWEDYHLDPIVIHVVNDNLTDDYWYWSYATCSSGSDPWFWTFDYQWFTFNDEGEFVLYRHKTKPIEVHTIQIRFNENDDWTENCAVAVRAASDVFIIYGCGRPTNWIIRRLNCDAETEYLQVYNRWGSYEIHLPTGTIVGASIISDRRLNVRIQQSRTDRGQTEGLCGNWNNNYADDFTDRNGKIVENSTTFARSWSVPSSESLFMAKPRDEKLSLSYMYCTCLGETRGELSPDVDCSWQENIPVCPLIYWDRKPCQIRSKRDTDNDEDVIDVSEDMVRHKKHHHLSNEWKNGWNQSTAENECLSYFKDSPAYETCASLENVNVTAELETCVNNIRISGTTAFISDSFESIISQCSIEIRVNNSLTTMVTENGKTVFEEIVSNVCPSNCKSDGVKHGDCVSGVCVCYANFTGDDCGINVNEPPDVPGPSEQSMCDISRRTCNFVSIYGRRFYSTAKLSCRVRVGKMSGSSIVPDGTHYYTSAEYKNNGEVKCLLSFNRRSKRSIGSSSAKTVYLVSVSTNSIAFSNEVPIVLFDSACTKCSVSGTGILCTQQDNICVIGDYCFAKNSSECQSVHIADSTPLTNIWIVGAVIGALTLIVLMILLVKCYGKKKGLISPICGNASESNYHKEVTFDNTDQSIVYESTPPISHGRVVFEEKLS